MMCFRAMNMPSHHLAGAAGCNRTGGGQRTCTALASSSSGSRVSTTVVKARARFPARPENTVSDPLIADQTAPRLDAVAGLLAYATCHIVHACMHQMRNSSSSCSSSRNNSSHSSCSSAGAPKPYCWLTCQVEGGGGDRQLPGVAPLDVQHDLRHAPAQRHHRNCRRLQHCMQNTTTKCCHVPARCFAAGSHSSAASNQSLQPMYDN